MRRTLLSLFLLCVASCAHRTGEVAKVGEGDARVVAAPAPGLPVTEGEAGAKPSGADEGSPALGMNLTKDEAGAPALVAPQELSTAGAAESARATPAAAGERAPVSSRSSPAPTPDPRAPDVTETDDDATVPDVAHAELSSPEFARAVAPAPSPAQGAGARKRLVGSARHFVGRRFRGDCTGFVRRVMGEAHVGLPPLHRAKTMTESLYRSLPHVGRPQPGDLAFFHATRSHDRPGSPQSRFTHVAMVEKVEGPRVTLIHRGSRGIRRFVMNLERPHDRHENAQVRRRRSSDVPGTRYLAAELFTGYATPVGSGVRTGGPPGKQGKLARGTVRKRRSLPSDRKNSHGKRSAARAVPAPGPRPSAGDAERE